MLKHFMPETVTAFSDKPTGVPSLSENTFLRYLNFIALYLAQGIPEGMLLFGIPAWMAASGKTAGEIGSFAAVAGLPWSFKIIVAPMMDRFTYLPMGRKRPWVLFGQLGLMVSFVAMAFVPDPLNNLNLFMISGFFVSFFGSFQDVATDGMAVDIVPANEQARANGFMWGSKIVGTSASLALGSWLLNEYGFSASVISLSVCVGLIMLAPLLLRERAGEKLLPWTAGAASPETEKMKLETWAMIFKSLFKVFSLRNSLLVALVAFASQVGFNFIATLLPVFTVTSLDWTNQEYSNFFATASLIGGLGGMLIGGIFIDKFNKRKVMTWYCILFIALAISFVLLQQYWVEKWFVMTFMVLYKLLYVFSCIGIFAIAMQCCWKKISASQFTLFMTIGNLGRVLGAKLVGPLRENLSWEYCFLFFAVMMLAAIVVYQLINLKQQKKELLRLEEI
ncbi:MAG TPA: MFS transporter [Bacteroidia bacterium]|nr:MFS transporter [Bacteroidia bacterium]HNU34349.1 MFS transporter [Bacteroidia bacterium]